jgi:hypothetical protein
MPELPVSEAVIAYWLSSYSPRYKENAGIISRTVIQCPVIAKGKDYAITSNWFIEEPH